MLDRKLLRDMRRLWAQGLAIALVAAAGVMTLLLGVGTYRALFDTRNAYYEQYSFADVFANATRVPNGLLNEISHIPGVALVSSRIQKSAVLNIVGMSEPATGLVLSLPDIGQPRLNQLFVKQGRLPDPKARNEVAVSESFALANGFVPGDTIEATLGGVQRTLTITGIALSPEFVYTIGSNDILPDNKRFGVLWMRYSDLATAYNMNGAFNSLSIRLSKSANKLDVIDRLDAFLKPFGGQGAYDRKQQISDAFLSSELTQLEAMSYILPPIFLGVAAFLLNMTLSRLVALEREQIGLMKALGYSSGQIGWHYTKFALLVAFIGVVLGWALGAWAARGLAIVYADFYKFPFLLFQDRPSSFLVSGLAAMGAAVLGSVQAVQSIARLSPAVAMRPPAPQVYRPFILDRLGITRLFPQGVVMALRNLSRRPVRAVLTVVGISLSTGLLVVGLFTTDAFDYIVDITYFRADRQHATINFARPVSPTGLYEVARLPGVLSVEPTRDLGVILRNGRVERRSVLTGKPTKADLSRLIDTHLQPIQMPDYGIALSKTLADILSIGVGDMIEIELLDGSEKTLKLPVTLIVEQFMGLGAYMNIKALNRALGESELASGAHLWIDTKMTDALYSSVKGLPLAVGLRLQRKSLEMFRKTVGENMGISMGVYVVLACIIIFGVVYNAMRIQFSERARELASLRVLGMTRFEVSVILLTELAILTAIAIPLGWLTGYGFGIGMVDSLKSELFRFPLIISRRSYATAGLIVLGATILSAAVVQRRVAQLDMISVLKTRE